MMCWHDMIFLFFSEGCRHLDHVNISWCSQVSDDGITMLARGCHKLRILICKGCQQVKTFGQV